MNCWNSREIWEEFQRFNLCQSFSSNFLWLQWSSTGIPPEWWKDVLVVCAAIAAKLNLIAFICLILLYILFLSFINITCNFVIAICYFSTIHFIWYKSVFSNPAATLQSSIRLVTGCLFKIFAIRQIGNRNSSIRTSWR